LAAAPPDSWRSLRRAAYPQQLHHVPGHNPYLTAKSMLRRIEALKREMPEMAERLERSLRDLASGGTRN